MFRFLLMVVLSFILISCSQMPVYRPDVQQGNEMDQSSIKNLRVGMTKAQVENMMGSPVLKNIIEPGQMFYIYTFKPNYGKLTQKHVILVFKRDCLTKVEQF